MKSKPKQAKPPVLVCLFDLTVWFLKTTNLERALKARIDPSPGQASLGERRPGKMPKSLESLVGASYRETSRVLSATARMERPFRA